MKKLKLVLGSLLVVVLISSCKKKSDDPNPDSNAEIRALVESLQATWVVSGTNDAIKLENIPQSGWENFKLTVKNISFDNKSADYETEGVAPESSVVWPASGSLKIVISSANKFESLVRGDVDITLDDANLISDGTLKMTFSIAQTSSSRVGKVNGEWTFDLSLQQ